MGFVTSNSWLDVAYGYELQRFFLSRFKVIAICESRCEPWFEQSAVNTVFTVLERCDDEEEKKNHLVRFVKAKKPLKELFPQNPLTDAQARWNALDSFVGRMEELPDRWNAGIRDGFKKFGTIQTEYVSQPEIISYEDEDARVRTIRQGDLRDEVERAGQTVKWGQYLRGPDIYFEILEKCADKFIPLEKIADVRFGIKTGINEFFYLTEDKIKHWGIEKEFLKPVIKSPKECAGIKLKRKDLKWFVFLCHKDKSELKGTNALKYIKWGEAQKTSDGRLWPEVESVKGRGNWYELPKRVPGLLLLPMVTGESLRCIVNVCKAQVDHNLFEVISDDGNVLEALGIYLNSAGVFLQRELTGRLNLGDGALKVEGIDWERILVPRKKLLVNVKKHAGKAFEEMNRRTIKNIAAEAKKKDRIEFEKAVSSALGLPEKSFGDILEGVVELVEERHLLPRLRGAKKKNRVLQDIEKLREEVANEVLPNGVIKFPDGFVKGWGRIRCKEIGVPVGLMKLGGAFFEKQEICDEEGKHLMEVGSQEEGKFIVYAKKKDELVIKVPDSGVMIKKVVKEYESYLKELGDKLYTAFMEKCGDHSLSENLTRQVFEEYGLPEVR